MSLLYYSPNASGGLADYAHAQANALADAGAEVVLLGSENFRTGRGEKYSVVPALREANGGASIVRKLRYAQTLAANAKTLARVIREQKFSHVLFGSYFEYLAPLWAGPLRRLADSGVVFGAVVHDPVRDFVLGPRWWHRWSVACGYSFLREAFVHESIELDTARPMRRLRTTAVPHGVFEFPTPTETRDAARARLDLPRDAKVMLAFGHIRDGKNLDLVLQAMRRFPGVYLLVAGAAQSSGQKPPSFYQKLARELGVADRCRWKIGYVSEGETGNLFTAADVALLTYSRAFRSASGVLNAAIFFQTPCLASGGEGNLRSMVQKYDLGIWVNPDDIEALTHGIGRWLELPPVPRWADYAAANSWQRNAEIVMRQMK